jgi:hypothetical protein
MVVVPGRDSAFEISYIAFEFAVVTLMVGTL